MTRMKTAMKVTAPWTASETVVPPPATVHQVIEGGSEKEHGGSGKRDQQAVQEQRDARDDRPHGRAWP